MTSPPSTRSWGSRAKPPETPAHPPPGLRLQGRVGTGSHIVVCRVCFCFCFVSERWVGEVGGLGVGWARRGSSW